MKKLILIIIWILFLTNVIAHATLRPVLYQGAGHSMEVWGFYEDPGGFDEETEQFLKAKELVFRSEWKEARTQLNTYLKDYPSGNYRDEALYWLAYSLNRIAMKEIDPESVISLLEEASGKLKILYQQYPQSLWQDDARKMSSEISGLLSLLNGTEGRDLQKSGLDVLIHLESEVAVPVFKRILTSYDDPEIRKRAVSLLGRYFSSSNRELLEEAARSDKDKDIRKEAAFFLDRAGVWGISTRLNYHVYGCRLLDEDQYGLFPEKKYKTFNLPPAEPGDTEGLLDAVRDVFKDKTSRLLLSARGQLPSMMHYVTGRELMISFRAGDYRVWIDPDQLRLSEDKVRGLVQFRHTETNQIIEGAFLVKKGGVHKLFVVRSGDRLSLLILQFGVFEMRAETPESLEIKSHDPLYREIWQKLARTFNVDDSFVHHMKFQDLMGWEIHSSRESWPLDDITGKSGKFDFGKAEAVSKSPKGWKLVGDLLLLREERRFIGRKSVLLDPDGRTVAVGEEISVPVDSPSDFEVTGSRKMKDADPDLPDYGRLKVGGHFTLKPGVEIQTELEYFKVRDFEKNLINFGQARAILPEKGSPSNFAKIHNPSRTWRLIGDILWIKDQDRLIGFGAILTNPDREIKAQGLISVPIDDPAAFRVLHGKTWKKKQLLLTEDERKTRYFYPCLNSNVQGWEVLTTLHSNYYEDGEKWDFSMAQATRRYGGQDWILIGHIMLLRKERAFLARQAALINSVGEIVYGAEIRVSTDDPNQNKVVKK